MRPRRRHERFVRRLETEFIGEGKNYRAISSDFSRYGLFIRTNHAFVPGTELAIVIHLPNGTNCSLQGLVRRSIKTPIVSLKNGMGIELTHRDQNYIRFLKEFDPGETDEPCTFTAAKPSHPDAARSAHGSSSSHAKERPATEPEFAIIACSVCGVKNKVRSERLSHGPKCGKCGASLSPHA